MSVLESLKAARALISDPEHWTTGNSARNREGVPCGLSEGHSFCAIGALDCTMRGVAITDETIFPHDILRQAIGTNGIAAWNDSSTHDQVLAGFDKAIALASQ